MSNSFFVPFNHQPDSVTFHTAPVTLGGDEYAKLTVLPQSFSNDADWRGDQSLTIDGTFFYPQTHFYSSDFDDNEDRVVPVTGTYSFYATNDQWSISVLGLYNHDAGATDFNDFVGNVVTDGTGNGGDQPQIHLPKGATIVKDGGTSNATIYMTCKPDEQYERTAWLPPSTVISSGDGSIVIPYMLERYNTYS